MSLEVKKDYLFRGLSQMLKQQIVSSRCFAAYFRASSGTGCAEGRLRGGDGRNFSLCTSFAHFDTGCKLSFYLITLAVFSFFFLSFLGPVSVSSPHSRYAEKKCLRLNSNGSGTEELLSLSVCLSRMKPALTACLEKQKPIYRLLLIDCFTISGFFLNERALWGRKNKLNRQVKFLHSQIIVICTYIEFVKLAVQHFFHPHCFLFPVRAE